MQTGKFPVYGRRRAAAGNSLHGRTDEAAYVLFTDPAAGAGTLDLVDVDPQLAGQPAHRRCSRGDLVVPVLMFKDLPEQTAEELVSTNANVMYQFTELSKASVR